MNLSGRWVLASVPLLLALAAPGCSLQGEGERCSRKAGPTGNEDCQSGLVCKSSSELGGDSDICCPEGASNEPACIPGGGTTSSTGTGGGGTTTSTTTTSTGTAGGGGAGGTGGAGGAGGQGGTGGN